MFKKLFKRKPKTEIHECRLGINFESDMMEDSVILDEKFFKQFYPIGDPNRKQASHQSVRKGTVVGKDGKNYEVSFHISIRVAEADY